MRFRVTAEQVDAAPNRPYLSGIPHRPLLPDPYCTIALLLRALMLRRVKAAKMNLSMKRLLSELDTMRQVINIFPKKRRQKTQRRQVVLSRTSELQDKLIDVLGLKEEQDGLLG